MLKRRLTFCFPMTMLALGGPVAIAQDGIVTTREARDLDVPAEEPMFSFVVFGDRTGGPAEGIKVLEQAVLDTNLLGPDLVMTVGDLIQGYNQTDAWMSQMREYQEVMGHLDMPWFPVAGNHDVYWRGDGKPDGEHESHYEQHFGPLWYAFEYKDCWFVALYTDEGNPETGEKNFGKPECNVMSPEQLSWLESTLENAKDAKHVFIFLHHPRWIGGGYGNTWEPVHDLLTTHDNVSAVFAGHIHHMRYDPQDDIEYVTLATVGGGQSNRVPSAGYLHQVHQVVVREEGITLASLPVGEVMDVREITNDLVRDTTRLADARPSMNGPVHMASSGMSDATLEASFTNTTSGTVEIELVPRSDDSRWTFTPDHRHEVIQPGASATFSYQVRRPADSIDAHYRDIEFAMNADYLTNVRRYPIPEQSIPVPVVVDLERPSTPGTEMVLDLDGRDDHVAVSPWLLQVPDGPMTVECWMHARSFSSRTGLLCKTENSEYGIFVNDGLPSFSIFLGNRYAEARASESMLRTDEWHHVAGVFDGEQVRLYVDGVRIASVDRRGRRRVNSLPFLIGADVTGQGTATSHFDGLIDAVRVSSVARYDDDFTPARRFSSDGDTALLLNMDAAVHRWLFDESGHKAHPSLQGGSKVGASR